jgi:steroid delta-isomerase-like uncharacterized protein
MDPRALLEQHTEEVWNRGNLDAVGEFISEDYVEHDPSVRDQFRGPEGYRRNVEEFLSAFPDLTVTIEDSIVEGDKIAMRQRFRGTHEGGFMGIEPTGKRVESTSFVMCRIEGDKIAETWVETDVIGLLEQLGVEVP